MSFALYVVGIGIVIGGLTYGALLMHAPTHWIVAGAIVLTGLGVPDGRQGHASEGHYMKPLFWIGLALLGLGVHWG